jgi:hypothetical protein
VTRSTMTTRVGFSAVSAIRTSLALLVLAVVALGILGESPALAATQRSTRVALIPSAEGFDAGTLQTTGTVAGSPEDSFEQFTFSDVPQEAIDPGTLSQYDTVVLNQVFTSSLSEAQEQALSSFVTSGGKLIIHDADGTEGNDYQWLPVPASTGESCENCGHTDGEAEIVENNTLVSNEPSSPSYIDVGELPGNSDAVGDANVLVTSDPRWDVDIRATNDQNVAGAVDAYASDGGLILYDGFDTDFIGTPFPSGNDWLNKIWYDELNQQWDPDNLPHSTSIVGSSGHCGYKTVRVGVVLVCAESISGPSFETTASGNVVLDEGIAVGGGPVEIDQETKQISVASPAPISLLRSGGSVPLGSAAFSINGAAATDPISGKTGLATISLTDADLSPVSALRVGSLPFSIPLSGSATMYLDSDSGGGLIGAGSITLPMLGKVESSGSLALGLYAGTPTPAVVLGGAAHFGAVELGKGWKFEGLELSYQASSDTWTASGGLAVPIGSLHASGSLVKGQLDSLQVSIGGQDVPLGDSGFFFTGFGGGFSGLVNGPLKIDASTAGFWGVPKAPVEPFYLDYVAVTVNFAGSVSLDGAVSLAFKDNSPIHGKLDLQLSIHPFSATGSATIEGDLPGVSLKARGGAGFTTKHFTASEGGSVSMFGLSGTGEVIVSDKGLGASGTVCAPFHVVCKSMAMAGTWQQIGKLDIPAIVGGEPAKLITVSGVAAAGQSSTVTVPAGRSLLFVSVSDSAGAPEVRLRAPGGATYDSSGSSRRVLFTRQPQFGLVTIAVADPRPGRWTVSNGPHEQAPLQVSGQTLGSLTLVHAAAIAPGSSSRHELGAHAQVLLRWTSDHLPAGVRVSIVRRSAPHQVGVGLVGNLGANGRLLLPVSKLAPGRNYFTLAATLNGVPFQEINFPGQAWRAVPRRRPSVKHG